MGFQNRSSDVRPPFAVEGRRAVEVTHLALLGVKIAETAFWVYSREKQPENGCFFDPAREYGRVMWVKSSRILF